MSDSKFTQETIRLLLFVAWADDDVAPEEYDYLLRMARNAGLGEAHVMSLDGAMRDRSVLREPDMEYLKPHREEVLSHVQELIEADDRIAPEETDILYKIASALA